MEMSYTYCGGKKLTAFACLGRGRVITHLSLRHFAPESRQTHGKALIESQFGSGDEIPLAQSQLAPSRCLLITLMG